LDEPAIELFDTNGDGGMDRAVITISSAANAGDKLIISMTILVPLDLQSAAYNASVIINGGLAISYPSLAVDASDPDTNDRVDDGNTLEPEDDIPEIPQQSLPGIIRTDGIASKSVISVGASSNRGRSSDTIFSSLDLIDLTAMLFPDAEDIGEAGEIYVVLRTKVDDKKVFVALNEDGAWETWNASLKSLPTAKYVEALQEAESILIYSGEMTIGERLMYVGYSLLTDEGKPIIHTNGKPFAFEVVEAQ